MEHPWGIPQVPSAAYSTAISRAKLERRFEIARNIATRCVRTPRRPPFQTARHSRVSGPPLSRRLFLTYSSPSPGQILARPGYAPTRRSMTPQASVRIDYTMVSVSLYALQRSGDQPAAGSRPRGIHAWHSQRWREARMYPRCHRTRLELSPYAA